MITNTELLKLTIQRLQITPEKAAIITDTHPENMQIYLAGKAGVPKRVWRALLEWSIEEYVRRRKKAGKPVFIRK